VSLGFRPIACARRSDDTDASLGEGYRDALPLQAAKSARDSPDLAHPSNAGRQTPDGGMMSGAGPPGLRAKPAGGQTGPNCPVTPAGGTGLKKPETCSDPDRLV
jgi:hypothetical protein